MCLRTLHDRVRSLGLGAMYEAHWRSNFRDLLDSNSPDWASSGVVQKVIDLKAFASAGVPVDELIGHYRETLAQEGKPQVADSLPATMRAYRDAGYWPPVPEDLESAMDALGEKQP